MVINLSNYSYAIIIIIENIRKYTHKKTTDLKKMFLGLKVIKKIISAIISKRYHKR